jgi:hypothetical protein
VSRRGGGAGRLLSNGHRASIARERSDEVGVSDADFRDEGSCRGPHLDVLGHEARIPFTAEKKCCWRVSRRAHARYIAVLQCICTMLRRFLRHSVASGAFLLDANQDVFFPSESNVVTPIQCRCETAPRALHRRAAQAFHRGMTLA